MPTIFSRSAASSAHAGPAARPAASSKPIKIPRMSTPGFLGWAHPRPMMGVGSGRGQARSRWRSRSLAGQRYGELAPSLRRVARAAIVVLLVVLLLPYLIAPFYRVVDPVSTLMLWRWARGARVERIWMPLDRISPALPLAVISAEDNRFCSHRGIDFAQLRSVMEDI